MAIRRSVARASPVPCAAAAGIAVPSRPTTANTASQRCAFMLVLPLDSRRRHDFVGVVVERAGGPGPLGIWLRNGFDQQSRVGVTGIFDHLFGMPSFDDQAPIEHDDVVAD